MTNKEANKLLAISAHRADWKPIDNNWQWYQEWNRALFLHWKIDAVLIQPFIPKGLTLDTIENQAWVSAVAFSMEQIRPKILPALEFISNFHEVNVRTYVTDGLHKGVYFLSIEAQKYLSGYVAKTFSGLPYEKADIRRSTGNEHSYSVKNRRTGNYLHVDYNTGNPLNEKTPLDTWLTERYYLFLKKGKYIRRFAIHHTEWPLYNFNIHKIELSYQLDTLKLVHDNIDLIHYSEGVRVVAWPVEILSP